MGAKISDSYLTSLLLTPKQAATARRLGAGSMAHGVRLVLDAAGRIAADSLPPMPEAIQQPDPLDLLGPLDDSEEETPEELVRFKEWQKQNPL